MQRRHFLKNILAGFLAYQCFPSNLLAAGKAEQSSVQRIAFGSCAIQDLPQPIWKSITAFQPDAFLFLGDNVYGDSVDPSHIQKQYEKLAAIQEFAEFREKFPVLATWDDHDYGVNDCGAEFPAKEESRKIFLDFFQEPQQSPRRSRSGIYTSYYLGENPRRVQIILLDLRWNRTPIYVEDGIYQPNPDPTATMLGEEQWRWLENELRQPANLRIIGSSIQLVSSEHRWEKWANYPADKERLLRTLDELDIRNAIFVSGDMHYGEISQEHTPKGIPVIDLTSSGLNRYEPGAEFKNKNRLALFDSGANFGAITIDWNLGFISLAVRDERNGERISRLYPLIPASTT